MTGVKVGRTVAGQTHLLNLIPGIIIIISNLGKGWQDSGWSDSPAKPNSR